MLISEWGIRTGATLICDVFVTKANRFYRARVRPWLWMRAAAAEPELDASEAVRYRRRAVAIA